MTRRWLSPSVCNQILVCEYTISLHGQILIVCTIPNKSTSHIYLCTFSELLLLLLPFFFFFFFCTNSNWWFFLKFKRQQISLVLQKSSKYILADFCNAVIWTISIVAQISVLSLLNLKCYFLLAVRRHQNSSVYIRILIY